MTSGFLTLAVMFAASKRGSSTTDAPAQPGHCASLFVP
jgi:hypothetical protein